MSGSRADEVLITTAHGDALAVALVLADTLRARGALPVVSSFGSGRSLEVDSRTADVVVDYVEVDAHGNPASPMQPQTSLAAFILSHVLAVPMAHSHEVSERTSLRKYLIECQAASRPTIATGIPNSMRRRLIEVLFRSTGVILSDTVFITELESRGRRESIDRGLATGVLVSTTDASLHGWRHHSWPVASGSGAHRVAVRIPEKSDASTVETILNGLTAEVMQEINATIGDVVQRGSSRPSVPLEISRVTERILGTN